MRVKELEGKLEDQETKLGQLKDELGNAHEVSQKKIDEQVELLHHALCSLGELG